MSFTFLSEVAPGSGLWASWDSETGTYGIDQDGHMAKPGFPYEDRESFPTGVPQWSAAIMMSFFSEQMTPKFHIY